MSVRLMAQVFEAQVQPTAKKLLLVALADYGADDGSSIFPSVDRIAAKVSLSRRQVFRMLRQLQNEGWLTQTEPATSRFPARYQLNISAMTLASPQVSPVSSEMSLGVTGSHPRGVVDVTPGVTPVSPNPSVDPSVDPSEKRERARAFDRFWTAYPRKVGKDAALKAWNKLEPPPVLEVILAALEWQRTLPSWAEGDRYIPHPSTYLNGRRWEDEKPTLEKELTEEQVQLIRKLARGEP